MIAGCMDRMRHDDCGDCARRDPCKALFARLFGGARPEPQRRSHEEAPARSGGVPPFLAFLGEIAKAMEPKAAPPQPSRFRRDTEAQIEALLEGGEARIEAVARALGLSRQTLYRRLKAEDTTFEELLDGVRKRLALRLVGRDGLSVKESAWRLGFSDPSAFSRAFKRWTGKSPKDFRGSARGQ